MTINLERAGMQARLKDAEAEKRRMINRAESLHTEIRVQLNTALIPVEDCDIARVDEMMDDLVAVHGEIAAATGLILRLRQELGD